jgi:hypothetical protein
MSEQNQTKQKPKGTPVTEKIIGAASNKMVSATKNLKDAAETALKLVETMDENTLKIVDQEEKLNNLQQDFTNKRTQQKIELELAVKADRKAVVDAYVQENSLVYVAKTDYEKLQVELQSLKTEFETKLKAEMGKAQGIADSKAESAKKLAEAEYTAKEAQNLAKIQNLEAQLLFATQQSKQWETQLNEERKASVERAKASSISTLNVGAPNGRN